MIIASGIMENVYVCDYPSYVRPYRRNVPPKLKCSFKETRKMLKCDSFKSICFTVGESVQSQLSHLKSTNSTKSHPFQKLDKVKVTTGQIRSLKERPKGSINLENLEEPQSAQVQI